MPGATAEEFAQPLFHAPEYGWLQAGREGEVSAEEASLFSGKAVRRPARQADLAPLTANPEQLARRPLLVWREHRADRRQHDVEGGIRKGDSLGIALPESDLETLGGG